VPESTWIPGLAADPPVRDTPALAYGWGSTRGATLYRSTRPIYDAAARENAQALRSAEPDFATDFPADVDPVVVDSGPTFGDSGSGLFSPPLVLAGVHSWNQNYRHVNESGNLYGESTEVSYLLPVYRYRAWIERVISGEGSSSSPPPGGSNRRRLTQDQATGDPLMTAPPELDVCDPGQPSCNLPAPTWLRGVLSGAGNYRGTASLRCVQAAGTTCSYAGVPTTGGTSARLRLGPATAPTAQGTREVMVWCRTTTQFPDAGSPTQPVLRVSFTNAEHSTVQLGYGWWDITPDQVGTGSDTAPLDTTQLATC
jgi:hypothetical protein